MPLLPAFLRSPAAARSRHAAADAPKYIAQAIGRLKPETLVCADAITNALLAQPTKLHNAGSAGTRREAFANLARSFADETASLPDSEAEQLVSALLVVMAATNGVWSEEYRRGSHALYMSLMGRRWADTGANALAHRARLHDPSWLPSHAELSEMMGLRAAADGFGGMGGWVEPPPPRTRNVLRSSLWSEFIATKGDVAAAMGKLLPVEEMFGRLDPLAHKTFTFLHWFSESNGYCQLLSHENVSALGKLLHELAGPGGTVLEVGAGNGRLSHFLNRSPGGALAGSVIATDIFGADGFIGSFGGEPSSANRVGVGAGFDGGPLIATEKISQEAAVEKYAPRVVVCSWMPEEDWTATWRSHPSVRAYVLIGEADGGQSGRPWPTWGLRPSECFGIREEDLAPPSWLVGEEPGLGEIPPFEVDGWQRHGADEPLVADVNRWMIGQGDIDHRLGNSTQTVVFTRNGGA